ncbi:unnamed protein product [Amoebophrya sp. A120]|nr:unnamed protein product [Amoebophrya sp. A120]|eukprot:GSA120T00011071001.1
MRTKATVMQRRRDGGRDRVTSSRGRRSRARAAFASFLEQNRAQTQSGKETTLETTHRGSHGADSSDEGSTTATIVFAEDAPRRTRDSARTGAASGSDAAPQSSSSASSAGDMLFGSSAGTVSSGRDEMNAADTTSSLGANAEKDDSSCCPTGENNEVAAPLFLAEDEDPVDGDIVPHTPPPDHTSKPGVTTAPPGTSAAGYISSSLSIRACSSRDKSESPAPLVVKLATDLGVTFQTEKVFAYKGQEHTFNTGSLRGSRVASLQLSHSGDNGLCLESVKLDGAEVDWDDDRQSYGEVFWFDACVSGDYDGGPYRVQIFQAYGRTHWKTEDANQKKLYRSILDAFFD